MEIIDCKSLMIGDWVYRVDLKEPIPVRILGLEVINYDTTPMQYIVDVSCPKHINNVGLYTDEICPIPLTAEILEKNGFAYKESDETCATEAFHQWHLDGSRFAIDDDSWWRAVKDGELHVKFGGFPLKYLHELQHALRLCGINKEIKL